MTAPEPVRVGSGDIPTFVRERLQNPERHSPLVVISVARGGQGQHLISPPAAAERLSALADIVILTDGEAGWELSKLVGGRLSCYWGAVRLYWPGFDSRTSKSYEHPVWLSRRIQALGADSVIDAIAELVSERQGVAPAPAEPEEAPSAADKKRIAELEAALAVATAAREDAERSRDEARVRAASLQREKERLDELLASATEAVRDLDRARIELEDRADLFNSRMARQSEAHHEREAALRAEHQDAEQRWLANLTEAQNRLEAVERERDAATDHIAAVQHERDSLVAEALRQRDETETQREAAAKRVQELEAERDHLRRRLESEDGEEGSRLLEVERELDGERKRADDAEQATAEAREKLSSRLDNELKNHRSQIQKLEEKRASDVADLTKRLEEQRIQLEGRITTVSEQRQEAVAARQKAAEEASALQEEQDRLRERVQELEAGDELQRLMEERDRLQESHSRDRAAWEGRVEELEAIIGEKTASIANLERRLREGQAEPVEESDAEVVDASSVEEAVVIGDELEHLTFVGSAYDSAESHPFQRPQDVRAAFETLNACASQRKESGGLGTSVEVWLKGKGVNYIPRESDSRRQKLASKLTFEIEGSRLLMEEHVRFGAGSDPQNALWVYMAWRDDPAEWVVGHVGHKIL